MPRLIDVLHLKGNPFEHYVAETEPDIAEYAVKPPYFEAIDARAKNTSSYILFGDRGAGKSATRLTIFKELWAARAAGLRVPLAVNMVDFSVAVQGKSLHNLSETTLIKEVAFIVIESLLAWLSSLEEDERNVFLEAMNKDELSLCYVLLRDHYVSRPEAKRYKSAREAMLLLNQAFLAKSQMWIERRWDAVTGVFGKILDAVAKRYVGAEGAEGIGTEAAALLKKESRDPNEFDSVLVLRKLVELAQVFDFSGIVLLTDKVDETEATNNSADRTAAQIHPLLARVQLMEIQGFSWIFFLWSRVKGFFEGEEYKVRLDKIGHATVSWEDDFFLLMLNRRVQFFSESRHGFSGLFRDDADMNAITADIVRVSMRSPRELIRVMDVIIREHDIANAAFDAPILLNESSVQRGLDKYVTDIITTIYGDRLLAQIFRLNKPMFSNKDVQQTFRVGAQSARTRIQSWESAGIIRFAGTRAAEGTQGESPLTNTP